MNVMHIFIFTLIMTIRFPVFSSEDPEIGVRLSNCLENESVPPETCAVSNVEKIDLEIIFDKKENENLPPLTEAGINPDSTALPNHFIVLKIVDTSTENEIGIKFSKFGNSVENGKETIQISIEILEEGNVRQNKIQGFVDQVKNAEEDQDLADEVAAKNAEIVSAMERLYTENRIGNYSLTVEYHSSITGSWSGQVNSETKVIEVLDKGSFFDSLQTP